jgi:hypothetical protein
MAYVDLNPIRAGIAKPPEESAFTSMYERIRVLRPTPGDTSMPSTRVTLLRFNDDVNDDAPALPFSAIDYLTLVDWTGRAQRSDKPGSIPYTIPPILKRLKIDAVVWHRSMCRNGNPFGRALGSLERLRRHARTVGQEWIKGITHARRLYNCV